jgi:RNA polymerase primary sigma factor
VLSSRSSQPSWDWEGVDECNWTAAARWSRESTARPTYDYARPSSAAAHRQRGKGFSLALGDIAKLIDSGKEKAYLTYGAVNDLIPHDVNSSEVLDDLLATIGKQGMDVLEGEPKRPSAREKGLENEGEASDEVELDLTPGLLDTTNDPVRTYLCEMGAVPLLTREGEVDIAKRIRRGQLQVLKALSRSPVVIRQVLTIGEDLRRRVS